MSSSNAHPHKMNNDEEEDEEFEDALVEEEETTTIPITSLLSAPDAAQQNHNSLKALQERAEIIQKSGFDLAHGIDEDEEEEEEEEGGDDEEGNYGEEGEASSPESPTAAATLSDTQQDSKSKKNKKKKKGSGIKLDKKKIKQIMDAASEATLDSEWVYWVGHGLFILPSYSGMQGMIKISTVN